MRIIIISFFFPLVCFAIENDWPGLPPDCWSESRLFHGVEKTRGVEKKDPWQHNTTFETINAQKPISGTLSPNKSYSFLVEGGRPGGKITIYAEKDYLVQITFSELYTLSDVKWINEKLLFMRPWWGRIAATDIVYDVEREQVIYSESLRNGYIAYQQYQETCPTHGCQCIEQK